MKKNTTLLIALLITAALALVPLFIKRTICSLIFV